MTKDSKHGPKARGFST